LILKRDNSQKIVDRNSLPIEPDACVYIGCIEKWNFEPNFSKFYQISTKHFVEIAPGACSECRDLERIDKSVISNHPYCHDQDPFILKLEDEGKASCSFSDNKWRWSYHPS